jgi:uncharacterized protein (TIGR02147 family)
LDHLDPESLDLSPRLGEKQISMLMDAISPRDFLAEELARRTQANPRYSQRAFARQLGLSPGELSEVMRGKRALSVRSALRIAASLGFTPVETQRLLQLCQVDKAKALTGTEALFQSSNDVAGNSRELSLDLFRVVSDWFCFAILSLADTDGFHFDALWISKRLGISPAEARVGLERLERIGLIERDSKGRLIVARDYVLSPSGIPSEAIRNYHRQVLERAIQALETQTVSEREISGVGLAIDPRDLPELQKEINQFHDKIVNEYGRRGSRAKEVYQLESALFRLTVPKEKKKRGEA